MLPFLTQYKSVPFEHGRAFHLTALWGLVNIERQDHQEPGSGMPLFEYYAGYGLCTYLPESWRIKVFNHLRTVYRHNTQARIRQEHITMETLYRLR